MKQTLSKKLLLSLLLMLNLLALNAQKKNIVLHYDFKNVQGKTVKDSSPSHVDATLMNGAKVVNSTLILGNSNGYLDMTAKAGDVVKSLTDFTIYARYFIDSSLDIKGYGYFLWCFSCLEANQAKEGPYHAYRINEQRCETSIGGYTQETGIQKSKASDKGKWITVIYRQQSCKGELYIDGELIGTEVNFPEFATIFTSAPSFNWIGRPPFNGDNYLRDTQVSDFRVYNKCITDKEMKKLTKGK